MLVICLRALILYFVVLIVTRLMGKRELGQMQPFELVISMLLANLASGPMANVGVPLYTGIRAILSLLTVHVMLSIVIQKSARIRNTVCGQPIILIYKGQINLDVMRRTRYNFADLMSQLRASGIFDASQVEYAVLETDGSLSILEKSEAAEPPQPPDEPCMPYLLVLDGKIQKNALSLAGYDAGWLTRQLQRQGYARLKDVAYASVDEKGKLAVVGAMQGAPARVRP